MTYFEWADDMSIDNGGPIDDDHRLLVGQVNELHSATSLGEGQVVARRLLHQLIGSTLEHIKREEAMMVALAYPRLDEHQREHQEFMGRLCELSRQVDAGQITVAAQLSAVLRDWLSLHIRRYDKDILMFQRKQEKARARAMRAADGAGRPDPRERLSERRHGERRRASRSLRSSALERRRGERRRSGMALVAHRANALRRAPQAPTLRH